MAHLTCVGHSRDELRSVIGAYAAAGVSNVLALRGDPPEGPTAPFVPHPEGLHNAVELVEMTRELGDFCVGVAAFPEIHPAAESADSDARYLAAKARAGAEFAITQLFFRPDDYFALVERVRALGVDIPIIPGIMPITNLAQITRMAELSGAALPDEVVERVEKYDGDPAAVRAEGIAVATELCDDLLAGGAPGLHFYTLNRSKATREIYAGPAHHRRWLSRGSLPSASVVLEDDGHGDSPRAHRCSCNSGPVQRPRRQGRAVHDEGRGSACGSHVTRGVPGG